MEIKKMMSKGIKIKLITALFAALIPMTVMTANGNDIHYTFTQTDSSYSFYGSFSIAADPKCLLRISFNHMHIQALAPDAKEVLLIDSGSNWNRISYTYQKYIFSKTPPCGSENSIRKNKELNLPLCQVIITWS